MPDALHHVRRRLARALDAGRDDTIPYAVPSLWTDPHAPSSHHTVHPVRFFLERIDHILARPPLPLDGGTNGDWSRRATVYNLLVRATTAYDHDGDGRLSLDPIGDTFRETGTFLKSIALLPTLQVMGFNTLHLLPVTAVGEDGHKGDLGSVYAIQNPYRIDPRLAEPILGLGPEEEFAAFVEAAHHLGMRVVVEFVFRTASLDADWAADHPEWFYWIQADVPDRRPEEVGEGSYGAPLFTPGELEEIRDRVARDERTGLVPPHPAYRRMFTPPPPADSVHKEGARWIGVLPGGTRVRVPGAFADWPPDDAQPPWTDVTYLRLYDHPDFNYMAYNTLRMYDARLARPEHRVEPLWQCIADILPSYQERFGIDGAMIDMGHALPSALKQRIVSAARSRDPDFAFWDEAFSYAPGVVGEGYNAIVGSYWWLAWRPEKLVAEALRPLAEVGVPLPFFAAPENHNTPRAAARPGGPEAARLAWALGCVLPAIPVCHSGLELAERVPVNTGLDFTVEEARRYPQAVLALFSGVAYDWEREEQLVDWITRILTLREPYTGMIADPDPATLAVVASDNPAVWAVVRTQGQRHLAVVVNFDQERAQGFTLRLGMTPVALTDHLTGRVWAVEGGMLVGELPALGVGWFTW